ncbi:poly-gamma-glutamate synthesis protein (capsule biosynthesis protein) [Halospina denitrificans]|uniref:Poly-gamma-glutamate synthesis protein (Capsule biosynthesis protein) n=1 Tax=Halospina denitrificans TaxID=332522 RepID=A0A4R7JP16_9GAMM|nr:CapA family protein [Halospina denitrificans]TDT39474.1 poly-gamma-glutamate synthesis protein (capsule biosynthesis protein) [Halospina denitrificans]
MNKINSLRISVVGDISLGDHPVCVGHGMRYSLSKNGDSLFSDVREWLSSSDITMGNLETVASNINRKKWYLPSYEMRGDPSSLKVLKKSGFNLLGVANNHAMQHGKEAFIDTLKNLREYGIDSIGVDEPETGKTKPFIHLKDGRKNVFIAVSMRPEEWSPNDIPYSYRSCEDELVQEVRLLREQHDGFFIVSIHWGLEYLSRPGPNQIKLGRRLVDEGVDVVVGHHPHVLQPMEHYKQGLILYSLGDFLFDLWHPETKLGAIAAINLKEGCVPEVEFLPIVSDEQFKPVNACSEQKERILELLQQSKEGIDLMTEVPESDYWDEYRRNLAAIRPRKYKYFINNIHKYPLFFLVQSIVRTFLRRVTGN